MPDRQQTLPERLKPATVGKTLKHYRLMQNLTCRDMADYLNVNVNTIYNWEYGRSTIPHDQLIRYVSKLELIVVLQDKTNEQRTQLAN